MSALAPVVCFGEMLLRYSPAEPVSLREASSFAVYVGGAEANVAIALSSLGQPARMVTVLPDNPLGEKAEDTLAAHGVDRAGCVRMPGRMGAFFIESSRGGREGGLYYDRSDSAMVRANPACIDWNRAMEGTSWLHISGISAALGPNVVAMLRAAVKCARGLGVSISFDCNFRPALWQDREGEARELLAEFAGSAELMFANLMDAPVLLGRTAEVCKVEDFFNTFPRLKTLATTKRSLVSGRESLAAKLATSSGERHMIDYHAIDPFVGRVGAGDAFAAALLYALCDGRAHEEGIRFAHRACLLKHAIPGDFADFSAAEVDAAM